MTTDTSTEPVIIVSADTHVGPRLVEDLRAYCPPKYLDDFDRYTADDAERKAARQRFLSTLDAFEHPNMRTAGHYDHEARMADYDRDGVAAGVIFHGSENGELIPFERRIMGRRPLPESARDLELLAVGRQIYNRWLADFVSQAPERHVGLAQLPIWDVELARAELVRAADSGLRGVNFPVIQDGIPGYNLPEWESLWSLCEERQLPLVTHVGGGGRVGHDSPGGLLIDIVEVTGWLSRRAIWWLILAGVFERHPGLKLVVTETPGNWWPATVQELESVYDLRVDRPKSQFKDLVPRRPTEYMARNVFFGASGASAFEAQEAIAHGVESNLLWGSDYPHIEGTFLYCEDASMPSVTKLSLRNTFGAIAEGHTRRMVGLNAIEVYNLDRDVLAHIARRIDAPTATELATPIDSIPEGAGSLAFRSSGTWS